MSSLIEHFDFSEGHKDERLVLANANGVGREQGGLAATFDLAAFRVSMIAPVKKSVNHLRILPSMRVTGKLVLAAIFCSGFAFALITLYSLLAILNDSSETIRTKG